MPAQGIDLLGLLSGGRAQVDAAALSAKAGAVAQEARADLLSRFTSFGEKVGAHMGSDFTDAIASGARGSSAQAQGQAIQEYTSISPDKAKAYILGGLVLAGVLYLLWKR